MTSSKSISKRMEQPHVPGTGSDYRTPVKLGTRRRKDRVAVPLLGQELRRRELLKCKDAFDVKDQAKANESEDIDMDKSPPIESFTNADDWQDVIDTDDLPTHHTVYISTPPPHKRYSRHTLSNSLRVPKNRNLREDAIHQYNEWKRIIPSLIKPMLDLLTKTSGKPSNTNITMPPCNKCKGRKTTPLLCLFWDRKSCILSHIHAD